MNIFEKIFSGAKKDTFGEVRREKDEPCEMPGIQPSVPDENPQQEPNLEIQQGTDIIDRIEKEEAVIDEQERNKWDWEKAPEPSKKEQH